MPGTNFIPSREADLITWSNNFNAKIVADPVSYGLSAPQAASYTAAHDAFVSAHQTANNPDTNSKSNTVAKNTAKVRLVDLIREYAAIVQATPTVTDEQIAQLGLTVRDTEPTPVPAPTLAPEIDMFPPVVRTVRLRLHNEKSLGRRGKPDGVHGALVFSYVGASPPAAEDTNLWTFQVNTTNPNNIEIQFPSTVAPGATVWFTAFWYNPRGESGPSTPAVYTLLPGSLSMAA